MNTRNSNTRTQIQAASTPRAKETARRRPALQAIDDAYYTGKLTDTERDFARWQVRKLCETRDYFDATQDEQAARYVCPRRRRTLSSRQIKRLNEHLEAQKLIWRVKRGTSYRTYITAYRPRRVDTEDEPEIVATAPTESEQQAKSARTALWLFMAAMQLADADSASFFAPTEGDMDGPESVTSLSPSPSINESGIPKGDTALPVCDAGGGGKDHPAVKVAQQDEATQPELPIVKRLRTFGVQHEPTLRQCSAAQQRAAEVLQACVAKNGGPGLFYEMWHKGVWGGWKTCGKRVGNSTAVPLDDDDAGHDKYIGGALGRYIRTGLEEQPAGEDRANEESPRPPEPEGYRRDAEQFNRDGFVPPEPRPLPAPSPTPPDDDPDLAKYRSIGGLPNWDEGGTP